MQQHLTPMSYDELSLRDTRELLTKMPLHAPTADAVKMLVERWTRQPDNATPLADLRLLMENLRQTPRNDQRVVKINTFVRTLGEPGTLAGFLDALLSSAAQQGSEEQKLSKFSSGGSMHCIYGWCGQTELMHTFSHPTKGTGSPKLALEKLLGYAPATWSLSIHIWQPNPKAEGFLVGKGKISKSIVEPPHSHPFDFVSTIVKGELSQSVYAEVKPEQLRPTDFYGNTTLQKVDGAWPPHMLRVKSHLKTIEQQVTFKAGDSYFMPFHRIHDVEVIKSTAKIKPAVTLFLANESRAIANAFVTPDLLAYHDSNPQLLSHAKPLPIEDWREKIRRVASYLRGETNSLNLDQVVKYDGKYAFFYNMATSPTPDGITQ